MFNNVLEEKNGKTFLFGQEIQVEDSPEEKQEINPQELLKQQSYEKTGVNKKFYNVSFDNYIAESDTEKEALKQSKELVQRIKTGSTNEVLMFYGAFGTGKTHLGSSIIREVGGLYRTAFKLVLEYENCNNFHADENKIQMLDRYSNSKLLVIDEVGRGIKTDIEQEILMYIINQRYENELPTVLISNMDKDQLIKHLGMAIFDRLTECCISVQFTGKSKRGSLRNV